MPAKGTRKADGLTRRKKVAVSAALERKIRERALACGMTESRWMRAVLEAAVDETKSPPKSRRSDAQLAHHINQLVMQVRKLGTNVNQLAHRANQGMVAIGRKEVEYLLNHHQLVFAKAIAVLEGARP